MRDIGHDGAAQVRDAEGFATYHRASRRVAKSRAQGDGRFEHCAKPSLAMPSPCRSGRNGRHSQPGHDCEGRRQYRGQQQLPERRRVFPDQAGEQRQLHRCVGGKQTVPPVKQRARPCAT